LGGGVRGEKLDGRQKREKGGKRRGAQFFSTSRRGRWDRRTFPRRKKKVEGKNIKNQE